jgi:hypothetical protein
MANNNKHMEEAIMALLQEKAVTDEVLNDALQKENKNITDCCNYIIEWVMKDGGRGYPDDVIVGQAIHYYLEDDLEKPKASNCRVVVNREVQLTQEEIEEAKKAAFDAEVEKQRQKLTKKVQPKKETPNVVENTLF